MANPVLKIDVIHKCADNPASYVQTNLPSSKLRQKITMLSSRFTHERNNFRV
uniref:Uncharacterized protein n=1 Tax=Arion vulgaris TaxID=1028688 RepID=A0A0B7BGC5_9EUPU